jgi:hypothetical protein
MKTITLQVTCCDDCPMFDNFYYHYDHTCRILRKEINTKSNTLPDECPLPDVDVNNIPKHKYENGSY